MSDLETLLAEKLELETLVCELWDALEDMVLSYQHEAAMDNPSLLNAKEALKKAEELL